MKLKHLLFENKKPSKFRYAIEVNDYNGEFEKLLRWLESMGNIGHSATIHCDVSRPSDIVEIYWDGDGADRIYSIKKEVIKDE